VRDETKKKIYSQRCSILFFAVECIYGIGLGIIFYSCKSPGEKANPKENITIAVIPMGTTHEFWKAIHAGALTACEELGVKVIRKG
jgi:ABC-type sugar transport system substrate-binding protein